MTPHGPRIFTVNAQSFGAGRSALLQASPLKRLLMVCVLILVAIPLLALGALILLLVLLAGLVRGLYHVGRGMPDRRPGPAPYGRAQTDFSASKAREGDDDSLRENVKVIRR